MRLATILGIGVLGAGALAGCEETPSHPFEAAAPAEPALLVPAARQLPPGLCSPQQTTFSLLSTNEFFPIGVGSWWFYEGEEDGLLVELEIMVLDETETVGGVTTRVLREREWEGGELLEISWNYFAESAEGTVCYFGEEVDIYEDGEVVSHDGAWRADAPGNHPGIMMPAEPRPGMAFQMEGAPGIAEDTGKIVGTRPVRLRAGRFREVLGVQESNPLDGGTGFKVFADGAGLVIDGPLKLVRYEVVGLADDD